MTTLEQRQFHVRYIDQCKKDLRLYFDGCQEPTSLKALFFNPAEYLKFKISLVQLALLRELPSYIEELKKEGFEPNIVEQEKYWQRFVRLFPQQNINKSMLDLVEEARKIFEIAKLST